MPVDLFGHLVLFLGGRGDLGILVADRVHRATDLVEAVAGLLDAFHAGVGHLQAALHLLRDFLGAAGEVAEQAVDFTGGVGGAARQGADFVGDHGEASALVTGARGFNGGVERQQVGLFGNRTDGVEDGVDVFAVLLQQLHGLGRLLQVLAELEHAAGGFTDVLLAVVHVAVAFVGTGGGGAAGTGDFVGGGHHFVERGADQLHRFTLAAGGLVHVVGDFAGVGGGGLQVGRGVADALHQLRDHAQELVEPAGQAGGFVLALHLELARQVAFAFGDFLQAVGHAANRAHDDAGKTGADDREHQRQYRCDGRDQPGQAGGAGHHFVALDQADKPPAEVLGTDHVGHVGHAINVDLAHAVAALGQFGVVGTQVGQGLEVVLGIAGVDQHVAVAFHQHQVAAVAQLDVAHQLGELLERHVQANHAEDIPAAVGDGVYGADQRHIVRRPVVGAGAHGFTRRGDGRLIPGAYARVVVVQFGVIRPAGITAVGEAQRQVGGARVAFGELVENRQQVFVGLGQGDLRGVGAGVTLEVLGRDNARVLGDEVDVLADAVEELLHAIVDLTDFAAAAVEEIGHSPLAHIQYN
ncbi:hypothetical protein ALQ29_01844 [Pseudomonas marginalis pv. marginalis]|uniref:NAD-specific glutamate dehydrogenase n=1 Tax=Pseudomonas marginalis pv. marginalis TaxID=97473 RepID=A0A3M4ALV6_PSEMA|nr:hypothetical protein ALQ29_01844 [Pseudomonas marginalis pv. marginalis]